MIERLLAYFRQGIWQRRLSDERGLRRLLLKYLRIFVLAGRGFIEDECSLRASALTFYSLLSVVPVVALAFGIAKGFGLDEMLRREIVAQPGWQGSVSALIVRFATTFLEQARGGLIAGIGVVVLLWTVISVLSNIERSFNDIWEIREGRSTFRQFTDYLSVMLVGTILFVIASGLTVALAGEIRSLGHRVALLGTVAPFIIFLLQFTPYVVIWILFSFVYVFMPNTNVNLAAGITGGLIAGTAFQLTQWFYIKFQVGVSSYGAVYGSFAALPLFLAWLQVSWVIVLFGAELSYAAENAETYGFPPDYSQLSENLRMRVLLQIVRCIVKRFAAGERPLTGKEIAAALQVPERLVHQSVYKLIDANLLASVRIPGNKEQGYQPACAIDRFTVAFVIESMRKSGINAVPAVAARSNGPCADGEAGARFDKVLNELEAVMARSEANRQLKDL